MTTTSDVVRWGQGSVAFELASGHAALLGRARTVFRPWAPTDDARCTVSFHAEPTAAPDTAEGGWSIRSSLDGEPPVVRDSVDRAVRYLEFRALEILASRTDGALAVHGALLDVGGRAALIMGRGEAGKSTLAVAAWLAGHVLLADDISLVDLASAEVRPGPRRVALRHTSRALVGEDVWRRIVSTPSSGATDDGVSFHPDEVDGRARPVRSELAAVVFLARPGRPSGAADAQLSDIAPAHSVLAWLPYLVVNGRLDPGDAIRRVAPLAERVPAFDLERGPLDAMVQAIRRAVEARGSR